MIRQEQLVMDRPARQQSRNAAAVSTIKTILFHVHQDETLDSRLQVALSVARACGAHLHLLHVVPIEAYTVVDAFGTFVSGEIVQALQEDADTLRAKLEKQLGNEDVSWDYEEITGELLPHLLQCAALADLVITGREPKSPEYPGSSISLLGDLLHDARTPLLVIGDDTKDFDPFAPAVIAWNGSYEAANALRAAVGLLKLASGVRLVTIEEPKDIGFPSTRALEYLSRQGIQVEYVSWPPLSGSFADELVNYASANRAAYIVMGGYSHSRAGEFLFGGVTRALLKRCPISLVIGH